MKMLDYYKILEVDEDAESTVIKKSYRVLAKKYHPDLNPDDEEAHKRFVEINEAYNTLSDDKQRKKYDELRKNRDKSGAKSSQSDPKQEEEANFTYKNSKEESVKINFENWDGQFEDFFGFNPRSGEVNKEKMRKKTRRDDTSKHFEDFFGFRKP